MKINVVTNGIIFNAAKKELSQDSFFLCRWNKGEPKIVCTNSITKFELDSNYFWSEWEKFLNVKDEDNQWDIDKKFRTMQILLDMPDQDQYYFGFFWREKIIMFLFNLENETALRFKYDLLRGRYGR
jgi:hypothetical protein